MESNPLTSLLGFWMMLQLFATLALLAGGIYLLFCLGRAASGLDRMANAMEDWVALQNQNLSNSQSSLPQTRSTPDLSAPANRVAPTASAPVATPFTPVTTQQNTQPETNNPHDTQQSSN